MIRFLHTICTTDIHIPPPLCTQTCLFPFTHRGYNVTNCVDVAGVAACPTPYGWQACSDSYEVR
jgi:hypothetical protein